MEGPTPVSALLHAATLVIAGIYLLLRFNRLFSSSALIVWIGAITALIGSVYANIFNDLKAIIAYSTISHLGFMVMASGLGLYTLALAHLINHAFFKASLFLSAGVLIHSHNDEQEIYGLHAINSNPLLNIAILIGSLSLIAFPFFSYSKELILNIALGTIAYPMALIAAFLSILYSFRLFHSLARGYHIATLFNGWLLVPIVLLVPLMLLSFINRASISYLAHPSIVDLFTILIAIPGIALLSRPSLSFKALQLDLNYILNMASLLNSIALTILLAYYLSINLGLECHILILVSYIGSISLIATNDWLTTLIAFELLNIAIYLLMALFRGTETATLKYLLLSAFFTMIALVANVIAVGLL
jgi:NADH-ubiquinone oxidoreductase chain 5